MARVVVQCDFDNWVAKLVYWTRMVPYGIGLALWVIGYWTGEPMLAFMGWVMTTTWAAAWPFKHYFDVRRADPYCPTLYAWSFPNDEMLYVSMVLVFVIGYTYLWGSHRSWVQWLGLLAIVLGPTIVLVCFDDVWWVYLAISFLIGALVAGFFIVWLWANEHLMAVLLNTWPLSVMYVTDTYIVCTEKGTGARRRYKAYITDYWNFAARKNIKETPATATTFTALV